MITTITPPSKINTTITYQGGVLSTSLSKPITITTIINMGKDADGSSQVNADWNAVSGVAQILNKPSTFPPSTHTHGQYALSSSLSTVATSGSYSDLVGLPTLGTASALNVSTGAVAASGEVVKGNDTRLSDARTPLAHNHSITDVTGLQTALDGKQPLSAILTGTTASFTTTYETKLSGIATGATANATDAQLRDRSTHTGTQLSSTISDFTSAVDTRVTFGITGKENTIAAGTTGQYWRGDKTWQTLDKSAVGLSNVDNVSDTDKPISTATQTALNGKQPLATVLTNTTASFTTALETKLNGIATGATANSTDAQLRDRSTHTGTQTSSTISDFNTAVDARVVSGITGKENTITVGTTSQYWRGDKSWQTLDRAAVGLGNVDNTSDVSKNSASATLTNKTISGAANTLTDIAQSSVTNLTTDLSGKQPLDGDLTSLAAASGTNTIYYRSAADTWSPVTLGANITFTGGTLAATGGSSATTGVVEADFGAVGTTGTSEVAIVVTGQTGITSSKSLNARIELATTSNHTIEDHRYAATFLGVSVGDIVDGVGFTIYVRTLYPMTGKFNIRWTWQ